MLKKIFSKSGFLLEASLLLALSLALCVGTWASAESASISEKLVRLHVIAVSDDDEEQALKLRVRDSVLDCLAPKLESVPDSAAAREILAENLHAIADAAAKASEGRAVTVSLGREMYPTREYGAFALPAGEYESLKVVLGEGKGQNWWCVVFPPLCTSVTGTEKLKSVMSTDDVAILSEEDGFQFRFRTLELWGELRDFFKSA